MILQSFEPEPESESKSRVLEEAGPYYYTPPRQVQYRAPSRKPPFQDSSGVPGL